MHRQSLGLLALALLGCGCQAKAGSAPKPLPGLTEVATHLGGQTPNLSSGEHGTTLTWQEAVQADDTRVRWQHRSTPGAWTQPATVVRAPDVLLNWADFPAMHSTAAGTFVATWLRRHPTGHGYGAQWSRTSDGGQTWASSTALHLDVEGPEYGFVSMAPAGHGSVAVFWLDGRASGGHHGGGAMQLRAAEIAADGTVSSRRLVDDRVCDCCQTSAAATASGPVVVYRDRSDAEVRDISIAGPGPAQRRTVADDAWTIAGCPVNGPAVAATPEHLAVAWFTGVTEHGSVRVAFATLEGDFSAPVAIDLGRPLGRVDAEWLDADHVLVSFIDGAGSAQGQAKLLARVLSRSGQLGVPWEVAPVAASNAAGFPRIAKANDQIVWAWTAEHEGQPVVRVAEASITSLLKG